MSEPLFQRIHVSHLHVDPIVQRALDPHRAQKLADKFDAASAGALIVNHRSDGKYYIIDGQHRHAAALVSGYDGKLNCVVHEALTIDREAAMFLALNDSKLVQAIDKFKMRVIAHDPAATEINAIIENYGWRVVQASRETCFAAPVALEKVYDGAGILTDNVPHPELVKAVMYTITKSWGHPYAAGHSIIVGGLGQLFARYADAVDLDKLTSEMSKCRPVDLVTKAKGIKDGQGGTVAAAMAKVLVGLHNKSRRTKRLPDWRWTR